MRVFCSAGTRCHSRMMSGPWLAANAPTRLAIVQAPDELVVLHAGGEEVVAQEIRIGAGREERHVVLGNGALHALIERIARQYLLARRAELRRRGRRLQVEEQLGEPIVAHELRTKYVIIFDSRPVERLLGLGNALVVLAGDTPLVGASRRPLPVLGSADLVVLADLFHLGGVLDDAAVRADEVAEDVVARPVAPGSPDRREASVAHASDAAPHALDIGHPAGDVVERRGPGARVGDAVMHAVAAHEAHVARAVRQPEAELLDGEALRR